MAANDEDAITELFKGFAVAMIAFEDQYFEAAGSPGWDDPLPDEDSEEADPWPKMQIKLSAIFEQFCVAWESPARRGYENPSEYTEHRIDAIEVDGDRATLRAFHTGDNPWIYKFRRIDQGWRLEAERDVVFPDEVIPCPL